VADDAGAGLLQLALICTPLKATGEVRCIGIPSTREDQYAEFVGT
jgi:hypothetical protein